MFLDLGCGAGPIALTLARLAPAARIIAVDVNERARLLCTANAARNGLDNIEVAAPGDVDTAQRFDLIWSNPPIRIGKAELHKLLQTWLGRLTTAGTAVLVVQRASRCRLAATVGPSSRAGRASGWPPRRGTG